jgi:hypothetical protein
MEAINVIKAGRCPEFSVELWVKIGNREFFGATVSRMPNNLDEAYSVLKQLVEQLNPEGPSRA